MKIEVTYKKANGQAGKMEITSKDIPCLDQIIKIITDDNKEEVSMSDYSEMLKAFEECYGRKPNLKIIDNDRTWRGFCMCWDSYVEPLRRELAKK